MAKQLNSASAQVNMVFTADASQAKAEIASLQKDLSNLTAGGFSKVGTLGLNGALTDVAKLKTLLTNATDEAGKLNLTKFSQGMSQSNTTIQQISASLNSLGPAGTAAFAKLAHSISQAEMPLKSTSTLLTTMKNTLVNSARWTIASSAIKAFSSGISNAYQYAQNLNNALNDIRIVTGMSADEMERFASTANRMASELSTTTKRYAEGSLIYFQQGLDEAAVKERTDITMKMANVTGESAETVSSQLTAVWNNFDNGTKSLEYFADVMVKLGAYTASSTDEISAGLQKFAPIAQTVGLSYEYAAAALATLTATTRESADTVGTSLKTIFARLQGLSLGETLEDGTDLNKYSKALATVGVDIKDANGELKTMDTILDELAAKWDTLTTAEQMATAETVGGTRQYTQLMSLMNNWDYFKELVQVSKESSGTLNEQAEIYAESWDAASANVQNSFEKLWSALIDDKFFVWLTNTFGDGVELVSDFASALGGLPGLIALISSSMMKAFGPQVATSIDNMITSLYYMTPAGKSEEQNLKLAATEQLLKNTNTSTTSGAMAAEAYAQQATAQRELITNAERLSAIERQTLATLQDQQSALVNQVVSSGQELENAERTAELTTKRTLYAAKEQIVDQDPTIRAPGQTNLYKNFKKTLDQTSEGIQLYGIIEGLQNNLNSLDTRPALNNLKEFKEQATKYFSTIDTSKLKTNVKTAFEEVQQLINNPRSGINAVTGEISTGKIKEAFLNLETVLPSDQSPQTIANLQAAFEKLGYSEKEAEAGTRAFLNAQGDLATKNTAAIRAMNELSESTKTITAALNQASVPFYTVGQACSSALTAVSSLSMGLTSLQGAWKTFKNPDISGFSKVLSISTSLSLAIPRVVTGFQKVGEAFNEFQTIRQGVALFTTTSTALTTALAGVPPALAASTSAQELWNIALAKGNAEGVKEIAQKLTALGVDGAEKIAIDMVAAAKYKETAARKANILAMIGEKAVMLLPYVAVAAGVYAVVKALQYAETTAERYNTALKEEKQLLDSLQNEYDEIQSSYDEMKSLYETYESATEELAKLTKGTVEYKEALLKANKAASDLADSNDNIQTSYDGVRLVVDKDSYKKAQNSQLEELDQKQKDINIEKVRVQQKENEANNIDFLRKNDKENYSSEIGGAAIGTMAGLAVAAVVATIATGGLALIPLIAGGLAGGLGGFALGSTASTVSDKGREDRQLEALDKVAEAYAKSGQGSEDFQNKDTIRNLLDRAGLSQKDQKLILNDSDLINSLTANSEETATLCTTLAETNALLAQTAAAGLTEEEKTGVENAVRDSADNSVSDKVVEQAQQDYAVAKEDDLAALKKGGDIDDILDDMGLTEDDRKRVRDAYNDALGDANDPEDIARRYGESKYGDQYGSVKKNSDGDYEILDYNGDVLDTKSAEQLEAANIEQAYETAIAPERQKWAGENVNTKDEETWRAKVSGQGGDPDEIIKKYNTLSPEIQAQLHLYDITTMDELNEAIAALQAEADSNPVTIVTKLSGVSSAKDDLKEDMSGEDWQQYWEDHADLGFTDGEKAQFMGMDIDEQQAVLDSYQNSTQLDAYGAYQDQQDQAEKYSEMYNALTSAKWDETGENILDNTLDQNSEVGQMLSEAEMFPETQEEAEQYAAQLAEKYGEAAMSAAEIQASMEAAAAAQAENDNYDLTDEEEETADYMADYAHDDFAEMQNGLAEEARKQAEAYAESNEALSETYDKLAENYEASADLGLAAQQWARHTIALNNALERLESDYKTLSKDIDNNKEGSELWCKAMKDLQEVAEDIADTKFVDAKTGQAFTKMAKDAGLFEKALNRDEKAIQELSKSAKKANLVSQMKLREGSKELDKFNQDLAAGAVNLDTEYKDALNTMRQDVVDAFGEGDGAVQAFDRSIDDVLNGNYEMAAVDFSAFLTGWANARLAAGDSIDDIQNALNSVEGFTMQVNTDTETIPEDESVTHYDVIHSTQPYDVDTILYEKEGTVDKKITKEEQKVTGIQVTAIPSDDVPLVNQKSGGGGGGGGNKGEKPKTPKAHKKSDMSKRYHPEQQKLQKVKDEKDKVEKNKERAFGKEKIKQAEEEIVLQQKKLKYQTEYAKEVQEFLKEDSEALDKYAKEFNSTWAKSFANTPLAEGIHLKINDDGIIENFQEIEDALLAGENKIIDMENAMNGESTVEMDLMQRAIDDMREYIERYEETLQLYEEVMNEMWEDADELDKLFLELTNIKVELKVDVTEDKLSFLEYLLGKIEEDAYKVADAMSYLGQSAGASMDKIVAYREGIDEIFRRRFQGVGKEDLLSKFYDGSITLADMVNPETGALDLGFTQDDIDQIREYRDGLIEAMEALNELRTTELDTLTESLDSFNEQLEGQTSVLESHVSILEAYRDIVDLIGTHNISQSKALLQQINNGQMGAVRLQLSESKNVYEALLAQRDEYQKALNEVMDTGNEDAIHEWQKRLADIEETVNDAKDNFLSNFQDALDTAVDILESSVELAADDFDKMLSPLYNSIDALQDAYDRQETVDNDYVQDYEKYYALAKDIRSLDEMLDDTDSIAAKNRLLKLQQEIVEQKAEDVKLSQYDLDVLEKRIELEKARMALEDAEDDKTTVTLNRDSEGNWGYVYSTDEENVREKEQEYEDKLKEYQDLNKDYIDDLQSQIVDFEAETRDALQDIWEDTTLNEAEKLAQTEQIQSTALEHIRALTDQMARATENQASTYDLMVERYASSNAELIDSFDKTRLSELTGYKSTTEVLDSFSTALDAYIVQLTALQKTYDANIGAITADASTEDWLREIITDIAGINAGSVSISENIRTLSKDMSDTFSAGAQAAITFEETYANSISSMVEENEKFIASLTNMIALLAKLNEANPEWENLWDEFNSHKELVTSGEISERDWDEWYKDWADRVDDWVASLEATGSYNESTDVALKDIAGSIALAANSVIAANADSSSNSGASLQAPSVTDNSTTNNVTTNNYYIDGISLSSDSDSAAALGTIVDDATIDASNTEGYDS